MKVDMKKDYDSIHWEFLEEILYEYCFPYKMVGTTLVCIGSVLYSSCFNGESYGVFFSRCKGKKQRDLLPSLLYVLSLNYLSRILTLMLVLVVAQAEFDFYLKCKGEIKSFDVCC